MELELIWEPLQLGGSGEPARAIVSGPFRIVPDMETHPYFTCVLEGPDKLALRCGSIRDALEAAEVLAAAIDGEGYDPDEDDDEMEDDEDEDEDDVSRIPPRILAKARRMRD